MKNANKKIGFKIRLARESKNITRDELAERMGVGKNYIYKVEAGIGGFSIGTMDKFASAIGVDISYFYDWREEKTEGDNKIKDVIAQYGSQLEERLMELLEKLVTPQQSDPQSKIQSNGIMDQVLTLIAQLPSDKQKQIIDRLLAEKFRN